MLVLISLQPLKQDLCQKPADTELHIDYFEKFTLLDHVVPGKEATELQEAAEQATMTVQLEKKPEQESVKDSPPASEETFVFVTDVEIVGEHLDEVFYGEGAPADAVQRREDYGEEARIRRRRESQRSVKESGSVLFEKEETTLTPIYISSGPPKIIDPILLEEPTAMSFMYSDLYEDAVGEKRRSDEEHSEAESVASEKTYKRRLSDSEEADGYLEKFILKDETAIVEVQPESVVDETDGRMMWPQSKFDMTGCLIRAVHEDAEDRKKTEEPVMQEISGEVQSAASEQTSDPTADSKREEIPLPIETEETEVSEKSTQASKLREDQTGGMDYEVKRDQRHPPESSGDEKVEKTGTSVQCNREQESTTDSEQPSQAPEDTAIKAPVASASESPEKPAPVEAASEERMPESDEKVVTEAKAETDLVRAPRTSTDIETSSESFLCEEKEAAEEAVPEDVEPVEVIADCESDVHAVIEITEQPTGEEEIQTQVHVDLQQATDVKTTDVHEEDKELEALTVEITADSHLPELLTKTDQESESKSEISSGINKPESPESVRPHSHKKHHEIHQFEQHQQEEAEEEACCEPDKIELITEVVGSPVHDVMKRGDDLILLVPKGQAVEMDVSIGQWSDKTASVVVALPEPVSAHGYAAAQETAPVEETKPVPSLGIEPEDQGSAAAEEQKAESCVEGDEDIFPPLRSLTPQKDLSGLEEEVLQSEDRERKEEIHQVENAPETKIFMEDVGFDRDVHREDVGLKKEEEEVPAEVPEVPIELDYEVIYNRDAKDTLERSRPESGLDSEERMEEMALAPGEELIEDDYEIIDAEEESQARLAAELLGMDWFCLTCGCLLSREDMVCVEHHGHEVTTVDNTYEQVKVVD